MTLATHSIDEGDTSSVLANTGLHSRRNQTSSNAAATTTNAVIACNDDCGNVKYALKNEEEQDRMSIRTPSWVHELQGEWGERLRIPEWEDQDHYRSKNGWKGRDLIHDSRAPVRILEYFVHYGRGCCSNSSDNDATSGRVVGGAGGGVGTTLTGLVYCTKFAESHRGFCHGGTMCSVLDDAIGWCAFCVTGRVKPWSGFTVQVNTNLSRPICVESILLVRAVITKLERRKVYIECQIVDPANDSVVHCKGDGMVVLNRGVLPSESTSQSTTTTTANTNTSRSSDGDHPESSRMETN